METAERLLHWCYLLLLLFLQSLIAHSKLWKMRPHDISGAHETSCVVVSLPQSVITVETNTLLHHLADVSFRNESLVLLGRLDLDLDLDLSLDIEREIDIFWENKCPLKVQGGMDKGSLNRSVFVFPRLKKDRSCLLRKQTSGQLCDVFQLNLFSENVQISDTELLKATANAVSAVNEKCGTFRNADGSLNFKGLHRDEILHNLFHVGQNQEISPKQAQSYSCFRDKEITFLKSHFSKANDEDSCFTVNCSNNTKALIEDGAVYDSCERIPVPSSSHFFYEYLSQLKPVIITGATEKWPAFKKWTKDFLKSKYGKTRVHIKATPNGEYEGVEPKSLWEGYKNFNIPKQVEDQLPQPDLVVVRPASLDMKFSEFLDLVENISKGHVRNMSAYLEYSSISDYFPELKADIAEMNFINMLQLANLNIWLSDGNTLGKLHFDPFDNLLCQISGEKHVTLFQPYSNEHLYEGHIQEAQFTYNKSNGTFRRNRLLDSTSMVMSPVDLAKPDLKRFPLFSRARPLKCKIKAGEILFMPAFWWHEVQSRPNVTEHRNLAVNFWYHPFLSKEFPCSECKLDVNPRYNHLL